MAFNPVDFTDNEKPLPVILMLDISGSMSSGDKIKQLNAAVRTMINELKNTVANEISINLCVISFESDAKVYVPMTPIENVQWCDLTPGGGTELSKALKLAKSIIEDREQVPSRAYRPAVILVSDGMPFNGWQKPMKDFIENGRSSKCDRMSMLIGDIAAKSVMEEFLKGSGNQLFFATDASQIGKFFKFVTMTTKARTLSKTPNATISMPSFDKENLLSDTVIARTPFNEGPAPTVVSSSSSEEDDDE